MNNLEYENKLESALSQENGCVVLINGDWGVGKTFFWNTYSDNKLTGSPVAYVSLFGKNSISDVQSEALIQIFKRNRYIGKINKIVNNIKSEIKIITGSEHNFNLGITGNSINLLLSLLKSKELKNCYVCIDDFERKSDSLGTVEVIGYASTLSERYGCKVILIMDENKVLHSDDGDIYKEYKEKMIDFEIKYCPNQIEVIRSILNNTKDKYTSGILNAVSFAQINNLRTIKRIARWTELLDKHLHDGFSNSFCTELGFRISLLIVIYFEYGKDGLFKLSRKISGSNANSLDEDEKLTILDRRIKHKVSLFSELDMLLWNFLDTLNLAHENLLKLNNTANNTFSKFQIKEDVHALYHKYIYDLTYSDDKYVSDMRNILEEHKCELIEIFPLDDFHDILTSLIDISKDQATFQKLKEFAFNSYVDRCINKIHNFYDLCNTSSNMILKAILDKDDSLNSIFQEKISLIESKLLQSTDIKSLLKRLLDGTGWNQEDEAFLNSIPNNILENRILYNNGFLEALVNFMCWRNRFKDSTSFNEFYINATDTLKRLGEDKLGSFRFKNLSSLLGI